MTDEELRGGRSEILDKNTLYFDIFYITSSNF